MRYLSPVHISVPTPVTTVSLVPLSTSSLQATWLFDGSTNGVNSFNIVVNQTSNQETVFNDEVDAADRRCDVNNDNADAELVPGEVGS